MRAVMLIVRQAAIDDCVKRCDDIVAAKLTVFPSERLVWLFVRQDEQGHG